MNNNTLVNRIRTTFAITVLAMATIFQIGCSKDDSPATPRITVSNVSVLEGDNDTSNLTFSLAISPATGANASVAYTTTDGTATTSDNDYNTASGTINFPAGSTSATVTVVINGDTAVELDETLHLNFSAPVGVAIGTTSATGTITNDDDANPAGYYTGSGTVKDSDNSTNLILSDLQALVYGNRIMLMSVSHVLLYDMQNIVIDGSSYTAVLTLYQNAENVATVNVSGTINEGVSLTGTMTGSGAGNGTFTVDYDDVVNAKTAGLNVVANTRYGGDLNTGTIDIRFDIDASGNAISSTSSTNAIMMSGCAIVSGSSLLPLTGNMYAVTFVLSGCDDITVNGSYTGLSTTYDNTAEVVPNGYMPTTFSNGSYSGTADFKKI